MSDQKHTPGKLTCDNEIGHLFCCDGVPIAIGVSNPLDVNDANANRFVLTWNCHDDLLDACKGALGRLQEEDDDHGGHTGILAALAEAIEEAETKTS